MYGFRSISPSSSEYFSPFPRGTCSLSVIGEYLVLDEWSTQLPTRFLVSRGTQERTRSSCQFRLRGYHPLCPSFPKLFNYQLKSALLHALQPSTSIYDQQIINDLLWSSFAYTKLAMRVSKLRTIGSHLCSSLSINARRVWTNPFSLALLGESLWFLFL